MDRHWTLSFRPISNDDIPILLKWRNSDSFRALCTSRKTTLTEREFRLELQQDFSFDRCEQVLILANGNPAGTAFTYRYSSIGRHVFATIYLDQQYRGRALGVHALVQFAAPLFDRLNLHKVYLEVHAFNYSVVRLLSRMRLSLEGQFRGHCVYQGVRHDLLTFAAYRETLIQVMHKLHAECNVAQTACGT